MFNKYIHIHCDGGETAIIMATHPKVVHELFLQCTASFDYQIRICIDGKELENLNPDVGYDGYYVTFYFNDSVEIKVGSRVEICLTFWYKDKIVKYHMGSINERRDEISQGTEHWTYGDDDQFYIDPDDVDCKSFLKMLYPEWRVKTSRSRTVKDYNVNDIIDVEFTEVLEEEKDEYRKQLECRNDTA